LKIEALERTIQDKALRIDKLSQQLDAALQQVQNLAVKAIEGSSNRNSFEAMKEIAIEQAKNAQKGK
jgi:flagellar biosynthesis chaperone FliJ